MGRRDRFVRNGGAIASMDEIAETASGPPAQASVRRASRLAGRHIDQVPDGERDEVRAIFVAKGFEGEARETVVTTIRVEQLAGGVAPGYPMAV